MSVTQGLPPAQADIIIERSRRLGCWPDDVVIDREPHDAPEGVVVVVAGARKGRPHTFDVDELGGINFRT